MEAIAPGEHGIKVVFADPQLAQRIIMEQQGKLKTVGGGLDALAEAIRADLSRGTPTSS